MYIKTMTKIKIVMLCYELTLKALKNVTHFPSLKHPPLELEFQYAQLAMYIFWVICTGNTVTER